MLDKPSRQEAPEQYDVLGAGAGGPLPAQSPWTVGNGFVNYGGAVTIGNPSGGPQGSGSLNLSNLYLNGSAFNFATILPIAGGTMTGPLNLASDPTTSTQAATKNYTDTGLATKVPLAGGTMTGLLTLSGAPTAANHATTKTYVDT